MRKKYSSISAGAAFIIFASMAGGTPGFSSTTVKQSPVKVRIAPEGPSAEGSNVLDPETWLKSGRRAGQTDELPATKTSYVRPFSNLFFGLSATNECLPMTIMAGPVFSPVKYSNNTTPAGSDCTWIYTDTDGTDLISNEKDLVVTYATDYRSAATTRNNLYPFPVLEASSASTSAASFTFPGFYQAGGRGEYECNLTPGGVTAVVDMGLTVADPVSEGTALYTAGTVPLFGYNDESDSYWSCYSFGELYNDRNWTKLLKYGDFFYSPDAPLVIDGIHTIAYGKISPEAKFYAEIYLLNGSFVIPDTPSFVAECSGITVEPYEPGLDFLSLAFKFDEPVVISKSTTPYFVVAISGFNDPENVEYFSPELSAENNPNRLGLGWVAKQMMWDGELLPMSWSSVSGFLPDENLVSFYIMLDGEFPWLESGAGSVSISAGETVSVRLDSYYDAGELTFGNLPSWLTAKASGRYGDAAVEFHASEAITGMQTAEVTISGPGVSTKISVTATDSGIGAVAGEEEAEQIYTLDGRHVASGELAPGVYVRRTGNVAKKIIIL